LNHIPGRDKVSMTKRINNKKMSHLEAKNNHK
jgi:hypothetical protein